MTSMAKLSLLLVIAGAFWNVGTSARGLETAQPGNPNDGFTLQSGYEGYLLSPQKTNNAVSTWTEIWSALAKIASLKSSKKLLVPFYAFILLHGFKIFKGFIRVMGLLAIGTLLIIPLCTFTSLCTISFANSLTHPVSFLNTNVHALREQVTDFARTYASPEKLEIASRFLQSALDTYGSGLHKLEDQPSEPTTADLRQLSSEQLDKQQNQAYVE